MPYLNQSIATVWNTVPTTLANMKFFISSYQHRLLISDSMPKFQTNAGNIILTLSKLHIRAIHHALSEIGTKRWFSYQAIAIKRNYRGQKLLVGSNRKHGFDLKTFISISNHSSSLRRYRGHYLVPLLSRQIQFDGGGTTFLFHPRPWRLRHLSSNFNLASFNRGNFYLLTDVM